MRNTPASQQTQKSVAPPAQATINMAGIPQPNMAAQPGAGQGSFPAPIPGPPMSQQGIGPVLGPGPGGPPGQGGPGAGPQQQAGMPGMGGMPPGFAQSQAGGSTVAGSMGQQPQGPSGIATSANPNMPALQVSERQSYNHACSSLWLSLYNHAWGSLWLSLYNHAWGSLWLSLVVISV